MLTVCILNQKFNSMKTIITLTSSLLILFSISISTKGENNNLVELKDSSINYRDGVYVGQSKAKYTSEPFWGHIQISLKNGSFTGIEFFIRDSSIHESVDSMYGIRHYAGIPEYQKQCVKDGNGIKIYPQRLLEKQNLDKVDAISGATWSYNIFKASAKEALKDAKITGLDDFAETDGINIHVLPNPFYSTLKLEYSLSKKCHVNLSFYDIQGKIIKNVVDQEQVSGNYCINWDDCPADGVYFYRLKLDDREYSGKLIKLKK
jgi:major membrane immunogen (membrane-anchored lipoprotein)